MFSSFKCKLVIFDLDGTLHSHNDCGIEKKNVVIKKEIYDILDFLKKNGIKIALVSLNSNANNYLKKYNIYDYFDYIEYKSWIIKGDYKSDLLESIQRKSQIPYHEMILFDDRKQHILEAYNLQIKGLIVNQEILLTWEDMMKGFSLFTTFTDGVDRRQGTFTDGVDRRQGIENQTILKSNYIKNDVQKITIGTQTYKNNYRNKKRKRKFSSLTLT